MKNNNKEVISNQIDSHLSLIQSSLEWADTYKKDSFARRDFKEYRRKAKKIQSALKSRCSIAAYGESQVGKSYLMSSLLSSKDSPFVIVNNGVEYSFVDKLNPSGGNQNKIESTGVITRFTTQKKEIRNTNLVSVQNLSVADIIMLILDSYYNDVKINAKTSLSSNDINDSLQKLQHIWKSKRDYQEVLGEDDIRDIQDYLYEVIGQNASNVLHSDFFDLVADVIGCISIENWCDVFELMWNKNANFSKLFSQLISEFQKIQFQTEIYVPFEAILRENGTLLQIQWLDLVCGKSPQEINLPVLSSDVYNKEEQLIASEYKKTFLSAFATEITVVVPEAITKEKNREFLSDIDLLDFPGARNRLDIVEDSIDYIRDMPELLRRGKVAYLFNKYVRTRKISSILFCHHNDQKSANLGNSINKWIEEEVGATPKDRMVQLKRLKADDDFSSQPVSPLFFIATKFNIDLSKHNLDKSGKLTEHWGRFTNVIPEIIGSHQWFSRWIETASGYEAFKGVYPLRDFFWSGCGAGKSHLFEGYRDGSNGEKSPEIKYAMQDGFPTYFDELRESFVKLPFSMEHFIDPVETWNSVATVGNDGSEAIRTAICRIAAQLDEARTTKFLDELNGIKEKMFKTLDAYFEPRSGEDRTKKTKRMTSRIRARLYMSVGANPDVFGRIIDNLMVNPEDFRKIAKDIIIRKTDTPRDFTTVNFIRANARINPDDGRDVNLQKLLDFFGADTREELEEEFEGKDYTIDDVIDGEQDFCSTVSDIVTKHILDFWAEHLNTAISSLEKYLPHTDDIILTFQTLVKMLNVNKTISENISRYDKMFEPNERLNAIADYASLELNNFISTVGRKYMTNDHIMQIQEQATVCGIEVDLSPDGIEPVRKKQPLLDVLGALDSSTEILKQAGYNASDMQTLRRLPLWDNFQRWQNLLTIGIILASGVSTKDPKENDTVEEIIKNVNQLYL